MTEKVREEYVILLLGAAQNPIPTIWHAQKEMFILTKTHQNLQNLFNFMSHYEGPYSPLLQSTIKEPLIYEDAYIYEPLGSISLTDYGREVLDALKTSHSSNKAFSSLISTLSLIRSIYDKLTKDELLLLIYLTYPEYIELSNIYDRLVNDKAKRKKISDNLLRKGLITRGRYEEIMK